MLSIQHTSSARGAGGGVQRSLELRNIILSKYLQVLLDFEYTKKNIAYIPKDGNNLQCFWVSKLSQEHFWAVRQEKILIEKNYSWLHTIESTREFLVGAGQTVFIFLKVDEKLRTPATLYSCTTASTNKNAMPKGKFTRPSKRKRTKRPPCS